MQISISKPDGRAVAWPSFPQCAYAPSSDPAEQNRRGPRVNTRQQLVFLERFRDGQWKNVTLNDAFELVDGVLFELGWRFAYRQVYDDPERPEQYKLAHWQIRWLQHLSRRLAEVSQ